MIDLLGVLGKPVYGSVVYSDRGRNGERLEALSRTL